MAIGSAALKRYGGYAAFAFDTFVLRRVRPFLFVLVINDRCNLDCFYCESKNTGRYDLTREAVWKALESAFARGNRALVISGGEPFLWRGEGKSLSDVVTRAREIGFRDVAVFTNGTFPLRIDGCTFIVTVDGTRDRHNAIRQGTYDTVLENARAAARKPIASITLSKANASDLEVAVTEIAASCAFAGITFNLLTGSPELVSSQGFLGRERAELLDRIWDLRQSGFPIVFSEAAYRALHDNAWKRPVRQVELQAGPDVFACCRDVVHPEICANCGYTSCVEISESVAGRPTAMIELLRTTRASSR